MSAISVSWLDVSWGAVYIETNYGLMQHSYLEIKDRLLKALDSEYNVVDMATVFDVVAVLEKTPITPEILESTRLGKVINECRRRTNNETLARRAKLLVRKWREMMVVGSAAAPPAAATAASNPATPVASTTSPVPPQQNGTNVRSPNTAIARIGASAISPSFSLPYRAQRAASVSPALSSSGGAAAAAASRHYSSNVNNNNNNNNNSNSNSYNSSKSNSGGSGYIGSTKLVSPSPSSLSSSLSTARSPLRDSKVESVPKTHVANKRLRKNPAASSLSPEPPTKVAKMNGALFAGHQQLSHHQHQQQSQQQQHHHNVSLHHKQQLQQEDTERLLSPPSSFGSTAYSAAAAERLGDEAGACAATVTTNDDTDSLAADQVDLRHREPPAADTIPEPEPDPPPAPSSSSSSSKKRSRKKANKKKLSEEDIVREKLQALSKTGRVKTTEELVAELKSLNEDRLQGGGSGSASEAAAAAAAAPATSAEAVIGSCAGTTVKPSLSNSSCYVSDSSSAQPQHPAEDGGACAGAAATSSGNSDHSRVPLECLDAEARVEREIADILARLPPLDAAQIRWDETPAPSPPASPAPSPTDEQLERYLRGRWDGVNGCVTHDALWRPDAEGGAAEDDGFREWHEMVARRTANDDLIHILPYSIVD